MYSERVGERLRGWVSVGAARGGDELSATRAERGRDAAPRAQPGLGNSQMWAGGYCPKPGLLLGAAWQQAEQIHPRGRHEDLCSARDLPHASRRETQSFSQPDAAQCLNSHKPKLRFLAGSRCVQRNRSVPPASSRCPQSRASKHLPEPGGHQQPPRLLPSPWPLSTEEIFSPPLMKGPFQRHPRTRDARAPAQPEHRHSPEPTGTGQPQDHSPTAEGTQKPLLPQFSKRGRASAQLSPEQNTHSRPLSPAWCLPRHQKRRASPRRSLAVSHAPRRAQRPSVNTDHSLHSGKGELSKDGREL